ncbi:Suppressor of Sensor Kinase (SLN1) [Clydaea vesicula]|uniref:Suppressor of Sensor Kinase (SLN1) n=1 Tax=Clydaea vesicula TaxID=447962 RepID=A0AAD5U8B4_9FUNG|nr:Suppressor of Sensor Kinase (SLN1) [Clydaea vesicula]KAJ3388136.1 Suppressor of Sensor Kinase (SLN1) [Lobulomyces angularis]
MESDKSDGSEELNFKINRTTSTKKSALSSLTYTSPFSGRIRTIDKGAVGYVFDILSSKLNDQQNSLQTVLTTFSKEKKKKIEDLSLNNLLEFAQSFNKNPNFEKQKPNKQVFTLLHELDLNLKRLSKSLHDPSINPHKSQDLFENDTEESMDNFLKLFPEWKVERMLGSGACGVVFAADHPVTKETLFAIKKTNLNLNPAVYYYAVIKVFKLIDHPYIIKYYGCEIIEDHIYLFMEYCNEGSIYDKIYKSPENELLGPGIHDNELRKLYIKQTLEALVYLHGHDVIHRDLKPANLLIKDGVLKLADFGAAKLWYKCCDKEHNDNNMSGSPCYLAPEVITDTQEMGPKGARDIWAVGCLLFEMVLGKEPWYQIDNIWSLYYLMGTWASRTRDFKSETSDDTPIQMLRGCRVCDDFESDDESQFGSENSEVVEDLVEENANKQVNLEETAENLKKDVGCGIFDINCIKTAKNITNPLITIAVNSKRFSADALDFLNLTLQWTPENRPTAFELLNHPYIKDV